MTPLGERLESFRKGKTQREYAKFLGVPLTSYTNWLKGPSAPKLENIVTICSNLGVSADWLLGMSGEPHTGPTINAPNNSGAIAIGGGNAVSRDCMECPLLQAHLKRFSKPPA